MRILLHKCAFSALVPRRTALFFKGLRRADADIMSGPGRRMLWLLCKSVTAGMDGGTFQIDNAGWSKATNLRGQKSGLRAANGP